MVALLPGVIVAIVIFLALVALAYYLGASSLEPMQTTQDVVEFPSLMFGSQKVEQRITWKDRPAASTCSVIWKVILYLFLATQFVLGVVVVASSNSMVSPDGKCPSNLKCHACHDESWGPIMDLCLDPKLKEEHAGCLEERGGGYRRLDNIPIGGSVKQGRMLISNEGGVLTSAYQHDLWSALAQAQGSTTLAAVRGYGQIRESVRQSVQSPSARRLQPDLSTQLPVDTDIWGAVEEYPEIPAVLLAGVVVLVPIWIAALRYFTKQIVWGTIVLDLVALVYLIIRSEFAWPFIVLTVIFLVVVVIARKKIQTAVEILKIAMKGLIECTSVFTAAAVVFLIYIAYVIFWELAIISTAGALEVALEDGPMDEYGTPSHYACDLINPSFIGTMRTILITSFMPTTFYFMNVKLVCVATGLGAWYLHAEDPQKPRRPAYVGLKWGFFDCAGPTFMASLLQYVVHEMRKVAKSRCWCANPLTCALRIVWCCLENTLKFFTKIMLLGHVFHGGDTLTTAQNCFEVLKKHLGTALVADNISHQVTTWSTCLFSVGLGFAGTIWMEERVGAGILMIIFSPESYENSEMSAYADIIVLVFGALLLWFALRPLLTLVVVIGFCQGMVNSFTNMFLGLFTGIFIASITSIVFGFVGQIVHNATDVIMYCYALEQECGRKQERFEDMYTTLKKQGVVAEGTPAEGAVMGSVVCASCGKATSGAFCPNCGAKQGDEAAWPDAGQTKESEKKETNSA